jgi:hypothetical protein
MLRNFNLSLKFLQLNQSSTKTSLLSFDDPFYFLTMTLPAFGQDALSFLPDTRFLRRNMAALSHTARTDGDQVDYLGLKFGETVMVL